MLEETIRHYNSLGSNVYASFIDASKAFDRVNHLKLFETLLIRNVPKVLIRLLIYWYANQKARVIWGSKRLFVV